MENSVLDTRKLNLGALIWPRLKPVTVSLPIGKDKELVTVSIPAPRGRREECAKNPEFVVGARCTFCREPRIIWCAVDGCGKRTNWMAELNGRGHDFSVAIVAGDHGQALLPLCPEHVAEAFIVARMAPDRVLITGASPLWSTLEENLIRWHEEATTPQRPVILEKMPGISAGRFPSIMARMPQNGELPKPPSKPRLKIHDLVAGFADFLTLINLPEPEDERLYREAYDRYNELLNEERKEENE